MPLVVTGEGYRDFAEPRFFETTTTAEVLMIRNPVHKAHAFVAAADGSTGLVIWKFDFNSVAVASATVLVPLNPFFVARGRWILVVAGGTSNAGSYAGSGSPEGVVTAAVGSSYWDVTGQVYYIKNSGTGNTGWENLVGL